jgi:hypothetical protein
MNIRQPHQWPAPGSIVSVPAFVIFRHKGIVSDRWWNGKPTVISNSARAGGIKDEPWDVFASGQDWADEGHPGNLTAWDVLHRARFPQRRQYNAIDWNCEDFVSYCHGLPTQSPQRTAVAIVAVIGLALAAARS